MICPTCKKVSPKGSNFCAFCGERLSNPEGETGMMPRIGADSASADVLPGGPEQDHQNDPGAPLVDTQTMGLEAAEDDTLRAQLAPGTAFLRGLRGPLKEARYLLDQETVTVGRHPDSDIFLDDITVSRHHLEFYLSDGRLSLADSGSLNGTYVNGTRAENTELDDGDHVQIGKFRMLVLLPSEGT